MTTRIDYAHMKAAEAYAELSYAKRLQVGSIITKDNRVVSIGYNGTPAGWDNNCENVIPKVVGTAPDGHDWVELELKTKPEVIHAEANAIAKLARSSESGENAVMYITHAPCFDCAKLIYTAGIRKVYYRNSYRNTDGIDFLNKCNIEVEKL